MLLKRTDMPCFRQSQNSFKKKSVRYHAHTMLTVFPKTCSDGPNPQVPGLTGENAESPGIARDCGVLKCSQRSLKSTGGHCVPTTRNQVVRKGTWVRIPPAAPKEEAKKDIGQKSPVFSRLPRPVDQRIYGPHFFDISILDLRSGGTQTRILNEESATCFWPGSWMQDPGFSIL